MPIDKTNRRNFVKIAGASLMAMPLLGKAGDEMPKLAEDDPTAAALGYKEKTSEVDAAKYPNHSTDQVCTGCVLYQGEDPEWGGCTAFPGKKVAGGGWCAAYAPKPS